jgi:hypothetical protein
LAKVIPHHNKPHILSRFWDLREHMKELRTSISPYHQIEVQKLMQRPFNKVSERDEKEINDALTLVIKANRCRTSSVQADRMALKPRSSFVIALKALTSVGVLNLPLQHI